MHDALDPADMRYPFPTYRWDLHPGTRHFRGHPHHGGELHCGVSVSGSCIVCASQTGHPQCYAISSRSIRLTKPTLYLSNRRVGTVLACCLGLGTFGMHCTTVAVAGIKKGGH